MVDVPCNGCTACCYGPIALHPSLGDDPSKFHHEYKPGYGLFLARKEDDSCLYLGEGKCTIWPNTPAVCRAFDCRVYTKSKWSKIDPLRDERVIAAGLQRINGDLDVS